MKKLAYLFIAILLLASSATAAWLTGWTYRKQIAIALAAGAGTDYQVKIEVHQTTGTDSPGVVYVGKKSFANFKDVRFTDDDGSTVLDYYLEEIETGYVADDGIARPFYPHQKPAYYYNGKTYIAWGTLDPKIIAYDHATRKFSDAVVVGTNPLTDDDHGVPDIVVDTNGYIHVFYGCHNSPMLYARSMDPEDVRRWANKTAAITGNVDADATYPIGVVLSSGTILLYHRGVPGVSRDEMVSQSVDGGDTWTGPIKIIDAEGGNDRTYVYDTVRETDTKVHMVWSHFESGDTATIDVYHAYHNPATGNLFSMDGTNLGVLISRAEAEANCKVFDSGANHDGYTMMALVGSTPHIVWTHIVAEAEAYCYFSKWTGAAWSAPVQITQYDYKYNQAVIIALDASNLEVYLTNGGAAGHGGNLLKWTSADGGTNWTKDAVILSEISNSNTGTNRELVHVQLVENYNDDIKIVFCQGEIDDWVTTQKVYAWGEGGILGTADAVGHFWVKVDDDLTANQEVYIYYENAAASSLSSGANTFIKFMDAEAANALDEWEADAGRVQVVRDDDYGGFTGLYTFAQNLVNHASHYPHIAGAPAPVTARRVFFHFYDWAGVTGDNHTIAQDGVTIGMIKFSAAQSTTHYSYRIGANTFTSAVARGIGEWHDFEYLFKTGDVTGEIDGTQIFSVVEPDTFLYAQIGSWAAYGHVGYYDDIFVAKYVDPEPVVGTAGDEQIEVRRLNLKGAAIIEIKGAGKITIK